MAVKLLETPLNEWCQICDESNPDGMAFGIPDENERMSGILPNLLCSTERVSAPLFPPIDAPKIVDTVGGSLTSSIAFAPPARAVFVWATAVVLSVAVLTYWTL